MTAVPFNRFLTSLALAGCIVATACTEPEVILPGQREDLRDVLSQPLDLAPQNTENQDLPIALAAQSSNANWTHAIGSPAYRAAHPALSSSPQLIWSNGIGAGDSRKQRITADPVVADGRIFTLDSDSLVTATSTSGATLWSKDVRPIRDGAGEATGGGMAVANGVLFVSLGYGEISALSAETGDIIWAQQLDATASGPPTVFGDLVYLVAGDDTGWAINASNGRIAWQIGATRSLNNVLGAPAPAITDDIAIFAFGSGEVAGVFRKGGLRRWGTTVSGQRPGRALGVVSDITGAPVIAGDVAYIANHSGRMVAVNVGSGERIWTARTGAIAPVWPAGDSIFAITDTNELVRLNAADGARIWGIKLPNYVKAKPRKLSEVFAHYGPIIAGGQLIVASNDGQIRFFDPANGNQIQAVSVPGGATTSPVVAGGTLYVVGSNGQLHAFR